MKIVFASLFVLASFSLFGQSETIDKTLNEYFRLLEQKQISEALDYVHPELIDMLGKETYEQQYDQLFNSPGIEVNLYGFSIDSISNSFDFEKKEYALVKYAFQMVFKVDMSKDDEGLLAPFLLNSYQTKFGKDNVRFEAPGSYFIKSSRDMFAIKSADFEGWKIIDFEAGMRMFLIGIIPEQVLKNFKK